MATGSLARLGRALRAPFGTLARSYNETAKKWPASTGIVTTLLKTSAADAFAQKVVEGKDDFDLRRHGLFCMFGFAYLGCWQYYLYNNLFVRIQPYVVSLVGNYGKPVALTFLDQCIHHPLMYFPFFYSLKGTLEGRTIEDSLQAARRDMWDNLKHLWTIWVPAQLVNFSVVPLHLRIPFVAGVSFLWTVVLSVLRGAMEHAHQHQHLPEQGATAAVA